MLNATAVRNPIPCAHPKATFVCGRYTALMWAAVRGRTDAATALMLAGADVSATCNDGCGPPREGPCVARRGKPANAAPAAPLRYHESLSLDRRLRTRVRTGRDTAEGIARARGTSVEYAEAVRKVRPQSAALLVSPLWVRKATLPRSQAGGSRGPLPVAAVGAP